MWSRGGFGRVRLPNPRGHLGRTVDYYWIGLGYGNAELQA